MKYLAMITIFLAVNPATAADYVRPQCQTEESRGLRYVATAMETAARKSDPWDGCTGICGPQSSSVVDSMRATQRRFEAEALMSLLKARALEAAHCPDIADAVLRNLPATESEAAPVYSEFAEEEKKEWSRFRTLEKWRDDHPQCKRVHWWRSSIGPSGSKEDFSGNFEGKEGDCSSNNEGEMWRGSEDDWSRVDPNQNLYIFQVKCATAMRNHGFGGGENYIDPKFCRPLG